MFQILVRCERSAEFGSRCSEPNLSGFWTAYDVTEAPPASFWKDYERLGWTTRDGKHYCPQHNLDLIGTQVTISRDYVEVAPGVRVRWPGAHQQGDNMHIEVQVDEQVSATEWRRLCVMLLLQHGGDTTIDDVLRGQNADLDKYTVAWGRDTQSFAWRVKAYHTPENDRPQDRPFGSAMDVVRFTRDQRNRAPEADPIREARERFVERMEPVLLERFKEECAQPVALLGDKLEG